MSLWDVLGVLALAVGLLNLVLVFALIKRVREHDTKLSAGPAVPEPILSVGERVEDFTATTTDGETIDRSSLLDGTLVGFFDPLCETCHSHLAGFAERARQLPHGRMQMLAVIRKEEEAGQMVAVLRDAGRVVVERRRGPVATAFSLQATPAFCRLGPDQVVVAHGYDDKA